MFVVEVFYFRYSLECENCNLLHAQGSKNKLIAKVDTFDSPF